MNNEMKAIENFIDFCDDMMIAEEGLFSKKESTYDAETNKIKFNFFGKEIILKVSGDNEKVDDSILRKMTNVLKIAGTNRSLYSYLYTISEKFINDVNTDPYFNGKQCKSGNDLMNSLEFKTIRIDKYDNCIYLAGEYWLDDEHGFSICFPDGKFIKAKKDSNGRYKTMDEHWKPIATGLGQYSDGL